VRLELGIREDAKTLGVPFARTPATPCWLSRSIHPGILQPEPLVRSFTGANGRSMTTSMRTEPPVVIGGKAVQACGIADRRKIERWP
jgi:hypothetical protein